MPNEGTAEAADRTSTYFGVPDRRRCGDAPNRLRRGVRGLLPDDERLHDLEQDDEREIGDRKGREEPEGRAPAAPDAGPARLRDDEIGDPCAQDRDRDHEDDAGEGPQVAPGQPRPAAQREVVGEVEPAQHGRDRDAAQDGAEDRWRRVPGLAPANLQPGPLRDWAGIRPAHVGGCPRNSMTGRRGRDAGVWRAISATAPMNLPSSSSPVKKPTDIRIASWAGTIPTLAKTRRASSSVTRSACQPGSRNVTSAAIRPGGVTSSTPGVSARRAAAPAARRPARACAHGTPTYIASHPALRARPITEGAWNPAASKRRASCQRSSRPGAPAVALLRLPRAVGTAVAAMSGRTTSAPVPDRPRSHFWPGTA